MIAEPLPPQNSNEPLQVEKTPASLYYRYAASSLDSLIVGLITALFGVVLILLGLNEQGWLFNIVCFLIGFAYPLILTKNEQATWGKQYFKIKVERTDGKPITWGTAVKREILGKILSYIVFGLGYLWALFDKRKQSWHDKIARTIVTGNEPLSKGRRFVAFMLVFGLAILAILGIIAVFVLLSLNPQAQLDKAKEMQKSTEERILNESKEGYQNDANRQISEQLMRTYDAARISGVQVLGRAAQAYFASNQAYPESSVWSSDLINAGEISEVPDGIMYSPGVESCYTNVVNNTWCYDTNNEDAIVFSKLQSQQRHSQCLNTGEEPYALFSVANSKGGIVCSSSEPIASGAYNFR